YPFRTKVYPGRRLVQFKDGRYEDRWEVSGGKIEWTMEIEKQEPILLAGEHAMLLRFFANHVGGTGSVVHVLVVRCEEQGLQVVFEAGGERIEESYSGNNQIQITHVVANRESVERYSWNASRGRFE